MKKLAVIFLALALAGWRVPAQTLGSYQTTVKAQVPNYYFTFDNGNLTSVTANAVTLATAPSTFTQFTYDVYRSPYNCAYFSAQSDTLADPGENSDHVITGGGVATSNSVATGSVTFMFKSLDPGLLTAQKYVFSAGIINSNLNALSLYFENTNLANGNPQSLKVRFGDQTVMILQTNSIIPDTWYYFALTYTEATNNAFFDATGTNLVVLKSKWYVGTAGGTLNSGFSTNALGAVAGDGTDFYIGNRPADDEGFRSPGTGVVDEFATWSRRLSDSEVQAQFANLPNRAVPPLSQYQSVITSDSPSYYFKLDGNYVDAVSGTLTLKTNTATTGFTYDYFGNSTNAVFFSAGGDALTNNGNLLSGGGPVTGVSGTGAGAISFLFRTLNSSSVQGERWLYGAGGSSTSSNGFGLFFENASGTSPFSLKLQFGNTTQVILQSNSIVTADWYYFAMNYTEATAQVQWWLGQPGGTLQSGSFAAAASSLAGQGNLFMIGNTTNLTDAFRNSTPSGDGRIDEFAIWHRNLAANEVTSQFNALVVTPVAPVLSITSGGGNVILSWPASTSPAYLLQSAGSLAGPWSGAGTAVVSGSQYVVTNVVNAATQFYRLNN